MRALIRFLEQHAAHAGPDPLSVLIAGREHGFELGLSRRGRSPRWRLGPEGERTRRTLCADKIPAALRAAGIDEASATAALRNLAAQLVAYASATVQEGHRVLGSPTAERAVRLGQRMQDLLAAGDEAASPRGPRLTLVRGGRDSA